MVAKGGFVWSWLPLTIQVVCQGLADTIHDSFHISRFNVEIDFIVTLCRASFEAPFAKTTNHQAIGNIDLWDEAMETPNKSWQKVGTELILT